MRRRPLLKVLRYMVFTRKFTFPKDIFSSCLPGAQGGQHSISASGLSNFKVDYQNTDHLFQLVPRVILYSEVAVFRFTI
ncbi:hypothetical protein VNO77_41692 [Canavalia gladiata]|uniref:Uncharacterized protein n=1 Tax=Canavalia gladiata TaxID=3824 RepID=A0AAN9JZQ0_CANGL